MRMDETWKLIFITAVFFSSFFCLPIYTISISCIIHIASFSIQSVNMKQV